MYTARLCVKYLFLSLLSSCISMAKNRNGPNRNTENELNSEPSRKNRTKSKPRCIVSALILSPIQMGKISGCLYCRGLSNIQIWSYKNYEYIKTSVVLALASALKCSFTYVLKLDFEVQPISFTIYLDTLKYS